MHKEFFQLETDPKCGTTSMLLKSRLAEEDVTASTTKSNNETLD